MKVTKLVRRRGHIYDVQFDDGTYITLDTDIVVSRDIKIGDIITEEQAESLENTSDMQRCKSRAMYYLTGADYTEKEISKKLKTAGFADYFVQQTVIRLKELDLINDSRFAKNFVEKSKEKNMSDREIIDKGILKGIPRYMIKDELDIKSDSIGRIKALLSTKYANKLYDDSMVQKTIAALLRKGFKMGDVYTALKEISEEI